MTLTLQTDSHPVSEVASACFDNAGGVSLGQAQTQTGYLLLEDGSIFKGAAFGHYDKPVVAELVFNTGMTGYQDILTDPSYAGQAVILTYPLIGNYGINAEDVQSERVQASALIVSEAEAPSHWKSSQTLCAYLKAQKIFGLANLDTRKLTRIIRSKGTQTCLLSSQPITQEHRDTLRLWQMPSDIAHQASVKAPVIHSPEGQAHQARIGVLDLGAKRGILNELLKRGIALHVFPSNTSAETLLAANLDAVLLSNGPGNPEDLPEVVALVQGLTGKIPLFGICLGHQVMALSLGAKTYKLPFGHRGSNHPVLNVQSNRVLITAQNHSYAVQAESLPDTIQMTYLHLHDKTAAGISDPVRHLYSVQFHPEAGPGPTEGSMIFDEWLEIIKGVKAYA
ncbi:MAG: glutamine-hydrolyzing carbamoyl-phosphate synthase small subunit [Vampirovibrionales bacterium]|nr:glutamine-hydrolyzing carbamoyl-phosphate synthase small subunit [Vampirovibrionales bacterium]